MMPGATHLASFFFFVVPSLSFTAMFSNVAPRLDVSGKIVNAHSGGLYRFPLAAPNTTVDGHSLFYLYGTAYPMCEQRGPICEQQCGYFNNTFVVYTSPDLMAWTLASSSLLPLPDADNVEYDELNVGWNSATGDFVLVYWSGHYGFHNNLVATARSRSPTGPFVAAPPIAVRGGAVLSDTVSLWVDEFGDGAAYMRYNTRDLPFRHMVERLTADWTASDPAYAPAQIFAKPEFPWYDGGGMARRGDSVYVQLSFDCCFCQWGSDALVFVAPSPLGPWAPQQAAAQRMLPFSLPPRVAGGDDGSQSAPCDLSGAWSGSLGGAPIQAPTLQLAQQPSTGLVAVTGAVQTEGAYFAGNGSIVFNAFPGLAPTPLVGAVGAYPGSSDPCSMLRWLPPYSPPGSFWCRSPACSPAVEPPANWTNEVNLCADGTQPPVSVADMQINPCSQNDVNGVNFTIPAQQFNILTLRNDSGGPPAILYYGERFRSALSGLKGEDFAYMAPLAFDTASSGTILPMNFLDEFTLTL